MLEYMLDTNICIYVIKNRPVALRERFDQLAEALCISTITLGELLYGVEKSARRSQNLERSNSSPHGWRCCRFRRKPRRISGKYEPSWSASGRPAEPTT